MESIEPRTAPAPVGKGWLALFLAGLVFVVAVSLTPGDSLPAPPGISDKLEHFATYLALAFAGAAAFGGWARRVWLAVALVLLGAALEGAQHYVPARTADVVDGLANAAGAVAGLAARAGWEWLRRRLSPTRRR